MTGFLGWLKGVPSQIWIALGAVGVIVGIIARERADAAADQKRKGEAETLKTVNKVTNESSKDAAKADAARAAAPRVSDPSELPDETQRRVFRD